MIKNPEFDCRVPSHAKLRYPTAVWGFSVGTRKVAQITGISLGSSGPGPFFSQRLHQLPITGFYCDDTYAIIMAQINPPREYKFVTGYSHKRRRRAGPSRGGRKTAQAPKQPSQPQLQLQSENSVRPENNVVAQPSSQEPETKMVNGDVNLNLLNELADWSYDTLMDPGQHSTASFFDQLGGHQNQMLFTGDPSIVHHGLDDPTRNLMEDLGSASTHSSLEESVSPPLLNSNTNGAAAACGNNNNIGHTITQLVARCKFYLSVAAKVCCILTNYIIDDQEFCIMPLTHDFAANPFRFTVETSRCSQLLLHCILALSYKHIHRDTGTCLNESRMHKSKALQMLKDLDGTAPLEPNFLDAVLLLMTLDVSLLSNSMSVA